MKIISLSAFFTGVMDALRLEHSANDRFQPISIVLGTDRMLRLNRDSHLRCIEVRKGTVWLTGSPGRADVLLGAGDRYVLTGDWPFVAQALEPAEVELLPTGYCSTKEPCPLA